MYHQGTVKGSAIRAVRVVCLLGLAGAGLSGMASAASAATTSTSAASATTAGDGGPEPVGYSCSLGSSGQPMSLTAMLSAHTSGSALTVQLVTQPVQLSSAATSALSQVSYIDAAANAPMTGMQGNSASLSGQSQAMSTASGSGLTELPSVTATGTVPMGTGTTGAVQAPPTLVLTPVGSSAEPSLTCTRSSTVQVQVATAAAGTGQPYTCTITVGTSTTTASQVPMRLSASQRMVTLSAPVSALGSSFPASATPMSVTGTAALSGATASQGSVPMTGLADSGNGSLLLSGHWSPQGAGMTRVFAPHRFAARLREQTAVAVSVSCVATSATTTSAQVMTTTTQVKVQASASPSASTAAMASAPAQAASATGAAPNTGGGGSLHADSELPLVAGGAAAVAAGLALTGYAVRRGRRASR